MYFFSPTFIMALRRRKNLPPKDFRAIKEIIINIYLYKQALTRVYKFVCLQRVP
jgi:hypothetical protein